jgi:hypothetical protein
MFPFVFDVFYLRFLGTARAAANSPGERRRSAGSIRTAAMGDTKV